MLWLFRQKYFLRILVQFEDEDGNARFCTPFRYFFPDNCLMLRIITGDNAALAITKILWRVDLIIWNPQVVWCSLRESLKVTGKFVKAFSFCDLLRITIYTLHIQSINYHHLVSERQNQIAWIDVHIECVIRKEEKIPWVQRCGDCVQHGFCFNDTILVAWFPPTTLVDSSRIASYWCYTSSSFCLQ